MPTTAPQTKDLWDRNWKWMIPLISLGGFTVMGLFAAGIVFTVFTGIKSSSVYETAIARALAHPAMVYELGAPVETGWWVSGSINVSGSTGEAELAIPISGRHQSAMIYLNANKRAGKWQFSLLEVAVDESEQRIDLMGSAI